MKKYITGLVVVMIAISSAAFTSTKTPVDKKATFYYWRSSTGNQFNAGSYMSVTQAVYDSKVCSAGNFICKFTSSAALPAGGLIDTNSDNVPDALNDAAHTPIASERKGN